MTSTCTCDPKGLPDVSDASCPLHGIVAFLESGAAIEPDDSSVSIAPPCECLDGGHDTGDGICMCGGALDLVRRAHPRQGAFVTEAEFARVADAARKLAALHGVTCYVDMKRQHISVLGGRHV